MMLLSTLHVCPKFQPVAHGVMAYGAKHPLHLDGQFYMGVGVDDDGDKEVQHAPAVPASRTFDTGARSPVGASAAKCTLDRSRGPVDGPMVSGRGEFGVEVGIEAGVTSWR